MERPDLMEDPRYATNAARLKSRGAVNGMIADWTSTMTRDEVLSRCSEAEVPCGPVYGIDEIFEDSHYAARGNILRVQDPRIGEIAIPNVVPTLMGTPGAVHWLGPTPRRAHRGGLRRVARPEPERDRRPAQPRASSRCGRDDPAHRPGAERAAARHDPRGGIPSGQHLREVQLAQLFGASRYPRPAGAGRQREGRAPRIQPDRGYVVRPFAGGDIAAAFEMRAQIEGLAARKAAERGLSPEAARRIAETIDTDARVLSGDAPLDDGAREAWRSTNAACSTKTIIEAADNRFIGPALQTVQRIPASTRRSSPPTTRCCCASTTATIGASASASSPGRARGPSS